MQSDTRSALVSVATGLVRQRGFNAVSYADLAEKVGIRKPSIHHHFPLKEDLGVEMVQAYTAAFENHLAVISATSRTRRGRLDAYAGLYREGLVRGEGCLCGVLASELATLPDSVRSCVERFFAVNEKWLTDVLVEPEEGSVPQSAGNAKVRARQVLSTFQGAVFVSLALGNLQAFEDAVLGLLDTIAPEF